MHKFLIFFIALSFALPPITALAQTSSCTSDTSGKSRAQLEKQRKDNEKRLARASKILDEVESKKEATLGQLAAVKEQISTRQERINVLEGELNILNKELDDKVSRIQGLTTDLTKLREEYGAMVYAASKANARDKLLFVFAAEDFNQFFARLNALRQYTEARRIQAAQIDSLKGKLSGERARLENKKQEKETLLASYTTEKQRLNGLEQKQTKLVTRLSAREQTLRKELDRRQQADRRLERLIADMVRREMRRAEEARRRAERAAERARKPASEGGSEPSAAEREAEREAIPISAENIKLSNSFAENKGKLAWPVASGFISGKYGHQPHPVLKGVYVENLGVNIQTRNQEKVSAVFQGEVGFVADIPGVDGKIVSIMHGDYFTVYSNLSHVNVRPGQKVKTRDLIGTVNTDSEGVSELQFQVWHSNDRMNPEGWLQGR